MVDSYNQKKHRSARFMVLAAFALFVAGCDDQPAIRIDGSSTVYPITEAVAEEFLSEHPEIRVTVGLSGTGGGFKKLINKQIDICDASREIKEEEVAALAVAQIDVVPLQVAFDGLAVLVNPANDWCGSLTTDQLKEIWRPESRVSTWRDLDADWPNEEIALYGPGTDSGTFDYFTKAIVGESGACRDDFTPSEDDNVLVHGIAEDKFALGYFGLAYYAENKERLKLVGIDSGSGAVEPSPATINHGSYAPLSRPLFLYVRSDALQRPEVKTFIDFYRAHASDLAAEVGYVPISDEAAKQNQDLLDRVKE